MDLVERHFFVSIFVTVFSKEPTAVETYVYLLGSESEAKAYSFTIKFLSHDDYEVIKPITLKNLLSLRLRKNFENSL